MQQEKIVEVVTTAIIVFVATTILVAAFKKKRIDSNALQDLSNMFTISLGVSAVVAGILIGAWYLLRGLVISPEDAPTPLPSMIYPIETNLSQDAPIISATSTVIPTSMGQIHQIQFDGKIIYSASEGVYKFSYYVDNDKNNKKSFAFAVSPRTGIGMTFSAKFSQTITFQIEPVDGAIWHITIKLDGQERSDDTVNGEISFQFP